MALIINGERIDQGLIEQEFGKIKAHYESLGNVSCCERDEEFREMAKGSIAGGILLHQEAERRGEVIDDATIDQEIANLYEDHGGKEAFEAQVGLTEEFQEEFREQVAGQLRVDRMITEAAGELQADDAAVEAYYQENLDDYMTEQSVRALHMLRSPRKAEDREAAYEELRDARLRILDGAEFEKEAAEHSDKPSDEIDLGFITPGEILEEFERVAFSMVPGEVSPVFVTQFGLHLIKVVEVKPAEPLPLVDIFDDVKDDMYQEQRISAMNELIKQLTLTADIEELDDDDLDEDSSDQLHIAHGRHDED